MEVKRGRTKPSNIAWILYLIATIFLLTVIFLVIALDNHLNSSLSKFVIGLPFLLIFMGKILVITDMKKQGKPISFQVGSVIGLFIVLVTLLFN
ncbi:hypothetical protein QA612_21380 [Evansella sp. AB-P1]|uniref:hypothetical protein n=1 Tax=Evansella sp. AB-P1 TaxID=3037653 RepID=UPI00241CA80B|nr:hypothetical protein [Evansella sp. AB-P1]MDG5790012.1 hypothetical protein [Evansella sp. AB-P1]